MLLLCCVTLSHRPFKCIPPLEFRFHPPSTHLPPAQLESLKLGWCKLGPEGARAISDLLMFNSSLRSLDLRGNELGNDGAIILGRGLK